MFATLGRKMYQHRRRVVLAWLVLVVFAGVLGSQAFARVTMTDEFQEMEAARAERRLEQLGATSPDVLGLVDGTSVWDPATEAAVVAARERIAGLEGVSQVTDYYAARSPQLVAADGEASVVAVYLDDTLDDVDQATVVDAVESELGKIDAPRVVVGGDALLDEEFTAQSEADLKKAELVSLPVVLVVLVVIFGGLVGAGLPLIVALVSVALAVAALFAVTLATDVSPYSINVVTMLGLGLAVDYSLLIVTRFREERRTGAVVAVAVERTIATAGRTVTFSGLTVAVSLLGLLVFDSDTMRSLAYGGTAVVIASVATSTTLLPALLSMWGRRIKVHNASQNRGVFYRLSRLVQGRAVLILVAAVAGLLVLGGPFLGARFSPAGAESLPASAGSRAVFDALEQRFAGHGADPITVVADTSADDPALVTFTSQAADIVGVEAVTVRSSAPGVTVIDILAAGPSDGDTARTVMGDVRSLPSPFDRLVGGPAASAVDYERALKDQLPYALGGIAVATFVLLFLMTGSVVVPLKAMAMNVLSLGASFGALIWIFQAGHLAGVLDFEATGSIDPAIPIIIFVFAFGLSMDYEVFLLSRIKEEYDRSGDNDHAVAVGLQRTGGIVTAAAILMVTVFLGFTAGDLITIKELGLGLALAVIVDATVVRMLLVPSAMNLMGDLNWWAPRPLARLHRRFGLREHADLTPIPLNVAVPEEAA